MKKKDYFTTKQYKTVPVLHVFYLSLYIAQVHTVIQNISIEQVLINVLVKQSIKQ